MMKNRGSLARHIGASARHIGASLKRGTHGRAAFSDLHANANQRLGLPGETLAGFAWVAKLDEPDKQSLPEGAH